MEGSQMSWDENPALTEGDEYEAEWESVVDDAREDPREGLPALLDIVERLLAEYDPGVRAGVVDGEQEPGLIVDVAAARQVRERIDAGAELDDEELASAIENVEAAYAALRHAVDRYGEGEGAVNR
jgi:hypothetical protein